MDTSLRARLEAVAAAQNDDDPAHDFLHVRRVAANAEHIARAEGADVDIVVAAALLHELFSYPKNDVRSPLSGEECARRAVVVLENEGGEGGTIEAVAYCIRVHPFSRGIVPETREGRVLQDADRLDALGAIGIARCFSSGATMTRPFYEPSDPFCAQRPPNDKQWTLDHFYRKLLHLQSGFHTETARRMAQQRTAFLHTFLDQLAREITPYGEQ